MLALQLFLALPLIILGVAALFTGAVAWEVFNA